MSGRARFATAGADAKLHPGCSFVNLPKRETTYLRDRPVRVRADANEQEQARRRQAEEAAQQARREEAQRQREIAQRAAQERENARRAEAEKGGKS